MRYYCIRCGMSYPSVRDLTINSCPKGPPLSKHVLYEGTEKSVYTCKYCGRQFRSIRDMTVNVCHANPAGGSLPPHVPAL